MKNNLFTIGEIAKIKGMTVKALRFYERIGLIKPFSIDPETKYRYYALEQFLQLDIIMALRTVEISPKEIKGILEKKDTPQLLKYLENQKRKALEQMALLEKTTKMIDLVRNTISGSISAVSETGIFTRNLPSRDVLKKSIKTPINEKQILMQFSEFPLIAEENNLLNTYETGYVSTPDKNGQFSPEYIYNAVALAKDSERSCVSNIPGGKYVCLCFEQENIQDRWPCLTGYLKENRLKPRLILQVDLLNDVFAASGQYFEWQVLV